MSGTHHTPSSIGDAPGGLLRRLGVLRAGLGLLAISSLPFVFFQAETSPWDVVTGQVIPALVVMVAWAIPFDALMARVFMSARDPAERPRYRTIIWFDIALVATLVAVWGPHFWIVLNP